MHTASNMPQIQFSDVDALDSIHVWAVGGVQSGNSPRCGLAIAFFDGVLWRPQLITDSTNGQPCSSFIGVSVVNNLTAWAVGGVSCPPYKTVNGGKTWSPNGKPLGVGYDTNRVVGVNRDLIWVTADNGIFRSLDGGASWEETESCPGVCYAVSAAGTRYAWASSLNMKPPGNLYRWVLSGEKWELQQVPADSNITAVSFVGARR
jgi:photosystem II stability/assembly factor-like uncharacterized protein